MSQIKESPMKQAVDRNQILLEGYNELLSLISQERNITKEEIRKIIHSTLKKHNSK